VKQFTRKPTLPQSLVIFYKAQTNGRSQDTRNINDIDRDRVSNFALAVNLSYELNDPENAQSS
jgi:hypothetical protein